jgi:fatty acid desaturase
MVQSMEFIDRQELKILSQLKPWKTAMAIVLDWAIIIFAIVLGEMMNHWLVWLIAVAVIAGRMHALGAMMHDFTHYRFIRNKGLSDWIGDIFLAWPLGTTVASFRYNHLTHHRYANTDKDPDWTSKQGNKIYTFPQEMRFAITNFLGYFVMISSIRDMRMAFFRLQKEETPSKIRLAVRVSYNVLILIAVIYFGVLKPYILYWLVPFFTMFFLFLYVRSVAEHCGETMDYSTELSGTRTVIPHFWERWFFCPHNINYHAEHHLYPSVPYYNLPALSDALMGNKRFTDEAHLTQGYLTGLLREVWLNSWWPDKDASIGADAAK